MISRRAKKLLYVGLGDNTGYGIAARNLVRVLRADGWEVDWIALFLVPDLALGYQPREDVPNSSCDIAILHTVPDYYPSWAERLRAQGVREIWGHTIWETDRVPDYWSALLQCLDGLIVPSAWNRALFRAAGFTGPIAVLPHLSEFEGESSGPALPELATLDDRFIFYSIGMWTERKALWLGIEAFLSAFTKKDPVAFVLRSGPLDRTRTIRSWRHGFRTSIPTVKQALAPLRRRTPLPIVLIERELEAQEIAALHRRGDCYVALPRAEGWGLGAYEAAFFGKSVIATKTGGFLDYLTEDTAWLIAGREVAVRAERGADKAYAADQRWCAPDLSEAARQMRRVVDDPAAAAAKGAALRAAMQENFAPASIARRFAEIFAR